MLQMSKFKVTTINTLKDIVEKANIRDGILAALSMQMNINITSDKLIFALFESTDDVTELDDLDL